MANRVRFLICVFVLTARAGLAAGTNEAVALARASRWHGFGPARIRRTLSATGQTNVLCHGDSTMIAMMRAGSWKIIGPDDWAKVAE